MHMIQEETLTFYNDVIVVVIWFRSTNDVISWWWCDVTSMNDDVIVRRVATEAWVAWRFFRAVSVASAFRCKLWRCLRLRNGGVRRLVRTAVRLVGNWCHYFWLSQAWHVTLGCGSSWASSLLRLDELLGDTRVHEIEVLRVAEESNGGVYVHLPLVVCVDELFSRCHFRLDYPPVRFAGWPLWSLPVACTFLLWRHVGLDTVLVSVSLRRHHDAANVGFPSWARSGASLGHSRRW